MSDTKTQDLQDVAFASTPDQGRPGALGESHACSASRDSRTRRRGGIPQRCRARCLNTRGAGRGSRRSEEMIFELSKRARADIKNITRYTLENFGLAQTEEYLALSQFEIRPIDRIAFT